MRRVRGTAAGRKPQSRLTGRFYVAWLAFMAIGLLAAAGFASTQAETAATPAGATSPGGILAGGVLLLEPLMGSKFNFGEKFFLCLNVVIALGGLGYALSLVKQVKNAPEGTKKMQEIAAAIREGANAYLYRQFSVVGVLILVITVVLYYAAKASGQPDAICWGRATAFFFGAIFSGTVGFIGMRMATVGNLRVAAAARTSFGQALQLGYRTGTITGMLTDGLGLFGGSLIFLIYGERAYEALLGFGFGGTLLALFMRVGGGIYTKAADVGADLVGKVEAGIPEDDPRNAATIADNVGDNVGDCAGMAADIFESYEVTIVAAMILGIASFGHKGVIFPLLVRAIGVVASIISTYSVRAGDKGTVAGAMKSVNKGFAIGACLSIIGFIVLGLFYLNFNTTVMINGVDTPYIQAYRQAAAGFPVETATYKVLDSAQKPVEKSLSVPYAAKNGKILVNAEWKPEKQLKRNEKGDVVDEKGAFVGSDDWVELHNPDLLPTWCTFGIAGLDMRAAWTCLIGIILAVALNKCTEYYTGTEFSPVKSLAKACETGHATNIIQGLAVGYESTVAAVLIIAAAIMASALIYTGTTPTFIAFGVAMCGIGMLTLTGNTISMDVFGPVADNANGIGEMGYNKDLQGRDLKAGDSDYMPPEDYKRARQILADLDAVGNTTKAITKGIAIGSAVNAAVSLFNSYIVSVGSGGGGENEQISQSVYNMVASMLTISNPTLFIGMLIGGAVPFLFSSMTIRAVGRAAFLIVKECRIQFRDKAIWEGTKKPDYGRVVNICTASAQKELVGPGLLAMFVPVLVGYGLGVIALAGFLGGMIVVGQLLAVFMANAGGAWDNAKKTIEDEPKTESTGKGSEKHKAAVTGDTVGDPLKDTAGPAINPLIKVMNMVSLLIIGLILPYDKLVVGKLTDEHVRGLVSKAPDMQFWIVIAVCVVGLAWAVWQSKRETKTDLD